MRRSIVVIILLVFITGTIFAGNREDIAGRTYLKKDGIWSIKAKQNEGDFRLNTRSITVKLKKGLSEGAIDELNKKYGVIVVRQNKLGFIDLELPENSNFIDILKQYWNSGLLENAEMNSFGEILGTDPGYASQYYLHNTDQAYFRTGYGYLDINVSWGDTWAYEDGSTNPVTVAVIDVGVQLNHGDLLFIDDYGYDFTDPGTTPDPIPGEDHGTSISGIIAAKTFNGLDMAGIAGGYNTAGAKIMALKAAMKDPLTGQVSMVPEVIDDAIIYAADNGAKVINMSFGTSQSVSIDAAISYAYREKGVLMVAASGNHAGTGLFAYPANHAWVMAVGGIDVDWTPYGSWDGPLEVVAPALNIRSLLNTGSGFAGIGTSYATPQVAGVAALLLSANPALLPMDVRSSIKQTALNLDGLDAQRFGNGLLRADHALNFVVDPDWNLTPASPQINMSAPFGGNPTINWPKVEDDNSYKVYRSNADDGRYHFTEVASLNYVPGQTNYSWTDNNVVVNNKFGQNTFYYRVTSVDIDGIESVTSNEKSCNSNTSQSVKIVDKENSIKNYYLSQNYPNPFNPITKISFSLAQEQHVKIEVFDSSGRLIKILANGIFSEGLNHVNFNGKNISSGVYYYTIKTNNFRDKKKMILIK